VTSLFVRVIKLELFIPAAATLKDKRQVLQSLITRVRRKFNVAVAETGFWEQWQRAELGLALLSNQLVHLEQMLQQIPAFI